MFNNKYGVFGMPVRSSSLTASQPPLAPPTAGSAVQGPEPGGIGTYPAMAGGGVMPRLTSPGFTPRASTQVPWMQNGGVNNGGQTPQGMPFQQTATWSPPNRGFMMQGSSGGPRGYGPRPSVIPSQSFDDGGVVDDQNVEQPMDDQVADNSNYTVDLSKALESAQVALQTARQQHGIPPEAFGGGMFDTMSKLAGKTGPGLDANLQKEQKDLEANTGAYAEGGEVEQQESGDTSQAGVIPTEAPQENNQQDPTQAVRAYIMGAGAMPPEQIMALEQAADPQGSMDPAEKKLRAIAMAGDPSKQAAALQHYRQKFMFGSAIARAALAKGDLAGAARHATQAYSNVPNGKSVRFMPSQQGLMMSVRDLTAGSNKGGGEQAQSFDDGGEVEDPVLDYYEDNQQAVDKGFASAAAQPDEAPVNATMAAPATPVPLDRQRFEELLGDYDKAINAASLDQVMTDYDVARSRPAPEAPAQQNPETAPPYKVAQAGGMQPPPSTPTYTPSPTNAIDTAPKWKPRERTELEKRAEQIFPWTSQGKERAAYIQQMEMQQLKNKGATDVAGTKADSAADRSEQRGQTELERERIRQQGGKERTEIATGAKKEIAGTTTQGKLEAAKINTAGANVRSMRNAHPSWSEDKIKAEAAKTGIPYSPPDAAPQGQRQGAPAGGPKPIPPAAVEKLKSLSPGGQVTPEIRAKFDAIFGPGATDRALTGR